MEPPLTDGSFYPQPLEVQVPQNCFWWRSQALECKPSGPLGTSLTTGCLLLPQWLPGPAAGPGHPPPLRAREHVRWQHHRQGGVHRGGSPGSPALRCGHGRRSGQNTRKPWAGHPQSDRGCGRDPLQATSSVSADRHSSCPPFSPHLFILSLLSFLSLFYGKLSNIPKSIYSACFIV